MNEPTYPQSISWFFQPLRPLQHQLLNQRRPLPHLEDFHLSSHVVLSQQNAQGYLAQSILLVDVPVSSLFARYHLMPHLKMYYQYNLSLILNFPLFFVALNLLSHTKLNENRHHLDNNFLLETQNRFLQIHEPNKH